ncbi:thiol-disulfide oxidoreductase DCC family protein [Stieleria varia]|uniref:Thiol-disulfide oxidoreductase n=1 Tax=Stieleria varia TaxID=2528005 RepID=A0A5C6AUW4_9BACT|nr:DUF393 domain-containing protein [Stieleria varia]TWU02812.1 hypothetical protein Pla52n_38720 [Stieleria varia]
MSSDVGNDWQVEVFYDGECPLCLREIKLLRRLDRKHRIQFTDIANPSFISASYGMTKKEFMDEIQGRLPGGEWITGVEVFRRLYAAIGLKPLVALTRLPGISHGIEIGYRVFAKNRLRLTGRCEDGTCQVN